MAILLLDVGNTRLKWAWYAPGSAEPTAHGAEFLEQLDSLAERSQWAQLPAPTRIFGCHVAGVAIRHKVEQQLDLWAPHAQWVVPQKSQAGVVNHYDQPSRLGADRWVALIGARHRLMRTHGQTRPLVVVMVGTAVTVDALDAQGNFLGGYILPGHGIMLRALQSGTAGLHVPTGAVLPFPRNTSDALTSGGTFAIAGAISRMVRHVRQHCQSEPLCYIAGGAAWKMAPHLHGFAFELCENLIFEGLLRLAQEP